MDQPRQQARLKEPLILDMFTTLPAGTVATFEETERQNMYQVFINGYSLPMQKDVFNNSFEFYTQTKLF